MTGITRFKANGEMGYPDQATPERFNQLVDETNNEISILSWKGLNFKNELAKPSAYQANATTTFLSTEFWFASQYADIIVKVENFNGNIATQWLLPHNALGKPLAYRLAIPSTDSWGMWKQIATTDTSLQILPNPSTNANDFINTGLHKTLSSFTNMPSKTQLPKMPLENSTEGELKAFRWSALYITQRFESIYGGTAEREMVNGAWQPWRIVATTDKIDISLMNGWYHYSQMDNAYSSAQLEKNGNKVTGSGLVSPGTLTAGTTLFVLPPGYRPAKRQITKMTSIMGPTIILEVYNDGAVKFLFDVASTSSFSLNDFSITV